MAVDKQRIAQLEEKIRLMNEAHGEEKQELNTTIAQLENATTDQVGLAERLAKLELWMETKVSETEVLPRQAVVGSRHVSGESKGAPGTVEEDVAKGREQQITLTFGEVDTSPGSLERFISHYDLVDEINRERGARVWTKPSYRALMLRMALRGPAADYLEQEARMLSPWVKDDRGIIEQLRARYVQNAAVELHIIAFETASQGEGEPLGEYMVRLQRLIENAYTEYPAFIKQGRVVWQFLNGARDKDVREALIREGWMHDNKATKSYETILKIAEGVVNTKKASRATGRVNSSGNTAPVGNINSSQAQIETKSNYDNPGRGGRKTSFSGSNRGGRGTPRNWYCYCCKTTDHSGGWKQCPKFQREHPKWKQGDPAPVF